MIRKKNLELSGDLFQNIASRIKKKYTIGFMCAVIAAILYKVGFIIKNIPVQTSVVMIGLISLIFSLILLSTAFVQVLWVFICLGTHLFYRNRCLSERKFKRSFKLNVRDFDCNAVYETAYVPFMGRFVIRRVE